MKCSLKKHKYDLLNSGIFLAKKDDIIVSWFEESFARFKAFQV